MNRFLMVSRRSILASGLTATIAVSFARAEAQPAMIEDSCEIGEPTNANQLCRSVSDLLEGPNTDGDVYDYRRRIFRAANVVRPRDPAPHLAKKVQSMWLRDHAALVCSQAGSRLAQGGILKLAVEKNSRAFINDAVRRWGVWLNQIDRDDMTVLDFIESEMRRTVGTPTVGILEQYRTTFMDAGALRAADAQNTPPPTSPYDLEIRPLLRTWDKACYLNEGLASVKRGPLWGYADASGREVIAPRFHGAFAFSNGLAAVQTNNRFGYIDKTGREVIPMRFEDGGYFEPNGTATVVVSGQERKIDRQGSWS